MKKPCATLLLSALLLSLATPALAAEVQPPVGNYPIEVNGTNTGIAACTMVPLRAVGEALGFTVTWRDGAVFVNNGLMHTTVNPGTDSYIVATSVEGLDGMSAPFSLGAAPYVSDGLTYVPLSLFDVLLGSKEGAVVLKDGKIIINTTPTVQIPNPFSDCKTLDEATILAGFSATVPTTIDGYSSPRFRAMKGDTLEVIYPQGEHQIRIRKATGNRDISGDYTIYPNTSTTTVGDVPVVLRGTDTLIHVATWSQSNYSFSISSSVGITTAEMTDLIRFIY